MNRGRFEFRPDGFTKGGRQIGQGLMAGFLLVATCVFVYFFSFRGLWERREFLATCVPVDAAVVKAGPEAIRSYIWTGGESDRRMYEPAVRFAYTVSGREFESDAYTCAQLPMQKDDAVLLSGSYGVGQKVTAWYPAEQPSQAFLVKAYAPMSHIGMLFLAPAIVVCGGIMLTALVPMGALDDPDPKAQLIAGGLGTAVGAAVFAHMLTQSHTPMPGGMWLMAVFLAGLPVLALAWGAWTWATDR